MNKQQFIEKCLNKILTSKYTIALALALPTEVYDDFIKEIAKVIHLQLSECWDMAGEEKFTQEELMVAEHMQRAWWTTVTKDTHKDWIKLSEGLMRKIRSLTSKQEDKP